MPSVSKESTTLVDDFGFVEDHHEDIDGYTVNFVTIREDYDLAPMLSVLPGGLCQCPHWGVVFKGRLTVTYADHSETIEAGEAYYMSPGHTPAAVAGTEFVQFSPAKELAAVMDAVMKGMARDA